jgi:hypothetical protein
MCKLQCTLSIQVLVSRFCEQSDEPLFLIRFERLLFQISLLFDTLHLFYFLVTMC